MNKILQEVASKESGQVASMFEYWSQMLNEEVEFWPINDFPGLHTESHCERVLLLALIIGFRRQLRLRSMIALSHCAIFHDTRRKDNYLDKGHGDRAAEYYKEYCQKGKLKFLPEVYATIKFHDRDDKDGEAFIKEEAPKHSLANPGEKTDDTEGWLEVYHDFKDADALDRYRLGPWGLSVKYLRTDEAKALVPLAQQLVVDTINPKAREKVMEMTRPFAERMENGE